MGETKTIVTTLNTCYRNFFFEGQVEIPFQDFCREQWYESEGEVYLAANILETVQLATETHD